METSNPGLTGCVALVTGAGRGIGQAIAMQLAQAGARVAVFARSTGQIEHSASEIVGRGGQALAIPADVTDRAAVGAALQTVRERWGAVEILINNAGMLRPIAASTSVDPDEWAAALAINVTAPAELSFTVMPEMFDRGWGRIVDVSSSIAANPATMPRANAYATSKAALEAHAVNLAAELAGTGVTVNVYRPGRVDTAMQGYVRGQDPDQVGTELRDRFVRNHAAGTLLTPGRSAAALLPRLLAEATGQVWDANDPLPDTAHHQTAHVGETR